MSAPDVPAAKPTEQVMAERRESGRKARNNARLSAIGAGSLDAPVDPFADLKTGPFKLGAF
ncbi:MAG: hypothetical protein KF889_04880 [Alphaproteobacteria bacterium]|nr:hypothetical protein [Alphaproteobacteria bacterium]MCW5742203.1 hypothetical protein [Alphaproteobacteria bacterium]